MVASTPRFQIRHPTRSDLFAPHTDMTNLAADVETALVAVEALGLPAEPWTDIPPLLLWDDDTTTGITTATDSLCRWRSHHLLAHISAQVTFTEALPTGTGYARLRLCPPGGLTWNGFTIATAFHQSAAGALTPISAAPTTFDTQINGIAVPNAPFAAGDALLISAEFEPVSGATSAAETEMLTALDEIPTEETSGE
ncbi:hypothetical protein [Glycomyces buryatensis]|uniref:Uncharacterized protein n=1 Tax=Glycomyces buryatensis TaxID=2570927 RepID=A0A4S8Q618_9ACTN|nr:hypothetical protein [Glycomyces buryatensis]THV39608.1 hypothetical protein FAB82_17205 [Glycomyces buryatensis]